MAARGARAAAGEGADYRLPRLGHAHNGRGMGRRLHRLVSPQRKVLQVIVYEAVKDRERVFAEKFPGRSLEGIYWSDDLPVAQAKALAEHIAAHPEDAGRTVEDFRWIVREIVLEPQEDELAAKEAEVEDKKIENDIVVPADASDKDAAVSGTPPALNVLSFDCSARSKPWRPVHQRPTRDQRRPTWKKWER
jgi:hypothetical protein